MDENENSFVVCLGEKGKKPTHPEHYDDLYSSSAGRDVHVIAKTSKDEILNADLQKKILNLKKELENHWNDLVNGKVISQKKEVDTNKQPEYEKKSCPSCGVKKVLYSNKYCQNCGRQLGGHDTSAQNFENNSSAKGKRKLFIGLILISFFFFAAILFYFYWVGKKEKNKTWALDYEYTRVPIRAWH